MPPVIDAESCKRCNLCVSICPTNLFVAVPDSPPEVAYPEECWHCNACVLDCPAKAIELRLPLNFMVLNVKAASLRNKECDNA